MSWRPMLRLAWRTALRSKGRTALVAVLVGLPVFAGVLVDLVVRTHDVPAESRLRWDLGAADAKLEITDYDRIEINGIENQRELLWSPVAGAKERDPREVDATRLLPAGSRLIAAPDISALSIRSGTPEGDLPWDTEVRLLAGADPMTRGMTLLRSGRYPTAPDEVAVSSDLGSRLGLLDAENGLRTNATVTAESTARVVGVVDLPSRLNHQLLFTPTRSSLLPRQPAEDRISLVDLPPMTNAELHALSDRLAARGVLFKPRDSYLNPQDWIPAGLRSTASPPTIEDMQALALGGLCVGFGLLEVVLLAGAAFAVGARRQTRELGLVAATGGGHRDVRRAVLAQGVVLGLTGALAGSVLAIGLPMLAEPVVERVLNHEIDSWMFAPLDYAVLIAIGVLSGLAAAVVPAIGASRMAPVDALSGRFRVLSGPARPPKLAIGLLVSGLTAGTAGSVLLGGALDYYRRELVQQRQFGMGFGSMTDNLTAPVGLCLLGFTLAALGLVRLMPALVSWTAALGRRFPLSIRLAFRDGSRHRHRTGPAAAAVMVVVAGSVGAAFLLAGSEAADRAGYVPAVPMGMGWMRFPADQPPAELEKLPQAVEPVVADLPAERTWRFRAAVIAPDDEARQRNVTAFTPDIPLGGGAYGMMDHAIWVAGPDFVDIFEGVPERERAAARQALGSGKVLVLNSAYVREDGTVSAAARLLDLPPDGDPEEPRYRLPAHELRLSESYHGIAPVVVGEETAKRFGWQTKPAGLLIETREPISQHGVDLANGTLSRSALRLEVERGYQQSNPLLPLTAVAAAGIVTLAGVGISVALSASEGRADLATLAAVGAQPRRRRSLAAAQALLVGGLGCVLGIGLGGFLAFAAQAAVGAPGFVVPWANLLATAAVIPLFAALCAALFTRSELRIARRAE